MSLHPLTKRAAVRLLQREVDAARAKWKQINDSLEKSQAAEASRPRNVGYFGGRTVRLVGS